MLDSPHCHSGNFIVNQIDQKGDLVYDEFFKEYGVIMECSYDKHRLVVYWPTRGISTVLGIGARWLTNLSAKHEKRDTYDE
tara:strand:- start:869 stop:1111 length:243 start_codon:yes stop_codon:yes gene_type:complete